MWVYLNCNKNNTRSFDLCARCGFFPDGQLDPLLHELCKWRTRFIRVSLAAAVLCTVTIAVPKVFFDFGLSASTTSQNERLLIWKHQHSLLRVVRAMQKRGEAIAESSQLRDVCPGISRIRADGRGNIFFSFDHIAMADRGIAYSETQLREWGQEQMNRSAWHLRDNWWGFIHF